MAMDKLEHGEKVKEAQKRFAVPRRQLLHYGKSTGGSGGEYAVLIAG